MEGRQSDVGFENPVAYVQAWLEIAPNLGGGLLLFFLILVLLLAALGRFGHCSSSGEGARVVTFWGVRSEALGGWRFSAALAYLFLAGYFALLLIVLAHQMTKDVRLSVSKACKDQGVELSEGLARIVECDEIIGRSDT
ncbi:MAG: hypothetical protein QNJ67_22620 [Kiloniellales bacterium]|nr:hypothetical protein [Kiloniellales bacterium]